MDDAALDHAAIEWNYNNLIFPLVRTLYEEAMILGILLVAFGILRRLAQEPEQFLNATVYQRLLIMMVIMTWTSSVLLSYDLYKIQLKAETVQVNAEEAVMFANLTLAMIPLELITALLVCAMFGVLAFRDYRTVGRSNPGMQTELLTLFALNTVFHLLNATWFILVFLMTARYGLLTEGLAGGIKVSVGVVGGWDLSPAESPLGRNLQFHFSAALTYACVGAAWGAISQYTRRGWVLPVWDWTGTLFYIGILSTIYFTRLGNYLASFRG